MLSASRGVFSQVAGVVPVRLTMLRLTGLVIAVNLGWGVSGYPARATEGLRVGVMYQATSALVSASAKGWFYDDSGNRLAPVQALEGWTVTSDGRNLTLNGPQTQSLTVAGNVRLFVEAANSQSLVFAGKRWYRGALELKTQGSGVSVINLVELEHYLYGVVPAEMPRSWPSGALKSQAVAARSYALANLGKHRSRGYDFCGTDECQVYAGAAVENLATNRAIDQTRSEVVTYAGRIVPGYFHSSAGGYTENSEDVWYQRLPYIRAVPDFDQQSPNYTWFRDVDTTALARGLSKFGISVGNITQLIPVTRSYSGRVKEINVVGTEGSKVISGETFRIAAGLLSTLFNLAPKHIDGNPLPQGFAFAGRGWGHGLGLSQWGAKTLSEKGYSYMQILAHYYPGAQLARYGG